MARDWSRLSADIEAWCEDQPEPASAARIETEFGLPDGALRFSLPDLNSSVVARRGRWLTVQADARRVAATATVVTVVDALAQRGLTATRRQVERELPRPYSLREGSLQAAWRRRRVELRLVACAAGA